MVALFRADLPASALGIEIGPASASEVLARRDDQYAVIDGPPFDERGPMFALRDKARGIDVASRFPTRGAILCVVGGRAQARRGGRPFAGTTVCVQGEPSLIEAGVVVVPRDAPDALSARSALVLRRDGNVSFVAARAASLREFAAALAEQLDAEWAISTGTGDSTALATRDFEMLDIAHARLPSWVVARRALPSPVASLPARSEAFRAPVPPAVLAGGAIAAGTLLQWLFGDDT